MRTVLTLACALVVSGSAMARLGDTRDAAEARYGLPKVEGTPKGMMPFMEGARELTFEHQGWRIRCALLQATDGKYYIVREEYRRKGGSPVRDFEREAVLEAEGGRQAWTRGALASTQNTSDTAVRIGEALLMAGKTWSRADGAIAREQLMGVAMFLDLPQARRYEAELRAIKERKSREEASKLYKPSSGSDEASPAADAPILVDLPDVRVPQQSRDDAAPLAAPAGGRGAPAPSRVAQPVTAAAKSGSGLNVFPFAILLGVVTAVKLALQGKRKSRSRKNTVDASRATSRWTPPRADEDGPLDPGARSIRTFSDLTWEEFEMFVGEMYRRKGYTVEISGGDGADGGIDLVLRKDEERVLVQCKNWKNSKVGAREIREFFGVVVAEHATYGIFVTAGEYTRDALEFAQGKPVELIDRQMLNALLADSLMQPGDNLLNVPFWAPFFAIEKSVRVVKPSCPFCKLTMALRKSRRGEFWGCSTYPKCKGKREARQHLASTARD